MLGCQVREVTAAVSVVACVVDYEARSMEDVVGMDVVGTLLAVATSRTRICIRITQVRTSRRVDTVDRMMGGILIVVVMAQGVSSQSPVNRLWFAT